MKLILWPWGKKELQGRDVFTQHELDSLRALIANKVAAPRDEKKEWRDKMRKEYNFYISDFQKPSKNQPEFSVNDFDRLLATGKIKQSK